MGNKMENKMISQIWENRIKLANAEKRKAQARHLITNNPFYLVEMDYWKDINCVNVSYQKRSKAKAGFG